MDTRKIIWTRSVEDWSTDVKFLQTEMSKIVHLPCIRTQVLRQIDLPIIEPNVAVTVVLASIKAAEYCLANPSLKFWLQRASRLVVLGAKSAAFLRSHGYPVETSSSWRGMTDLAHDLVESVSRDEIVISPGPKVRAFDLGEFMEHHGIHFLAIDIYETTPGLRGQDDQLLMQAEVDRLQRELAGVVCFASPSAVLGFTNWLDLSLFGLGDRLQAVCIGESSWRKASEHFEQCTISPLQSTESMFATALRLLAD